MEQRKAGQAEPGGGEIRRIGADRRLEAIERLLAPPRGRGHEHALRFLEFAEGSDIELGRLWSRLGPTGAVESTVLAVTNPGRTAMVFATPPGTAAEAPRIGALIDHACTELAREDVHLAQSLLNLRETLSRKASLAGQFTELAQLSYLVRHLPGAASAPEPSWPAGVTVRPFEEHLREPLIQILEASYRQTLDCPGLTGLRETSDILEGHRATGEFDPALWTLMHVNGRPGGALLLNPSPTQDTVELVYIGLAPEVRGRGLGRELLRHGLGLLAGRREKTVSLAVDEQNVPALALYRREGFRSAFRRVALIRSLRARAGNEESAS